jgi:hypothetical protein
MRAPRQVGNQPRPWWSIGYLAPRLVALAVVVDITLRPVPVGWIGQDGYRLFYEAFARNHHFQGRVVGDISSVANLPQRVISRSESWTTDAIGFRNAGPMRDIAGIVLGDSFGVVGLSDDANLSALLGWSTGCRIYNAASHREEQEFATPTPDRVVNLARYVGMHSGLVVFERVERLPPLRVPGRRGPISGEGPHSSIGPGLGPRSRQPGGSARPPSSLSSTTGSFPTSTGDLRSRSGYSTVTGCCSTGTR